MPLAKYQPSVTEAESIERNFTYHPPKDGQQERYESLRKMGQILANRLSEFCPPSRERMLAITKLEEAIFWANAAIARNE